MNRKVLALSIGLFVACAIGTAVGQPAGPPADYEISTDDTTKSPDGATAIE